MTAMATLSPSIPALNKRPRTFFENLISANIPPPWILPGRRSENFFVWTVWLNSFPAAMVYAGTMKSVNDIFGSDILLDREGQAVVAANGELIWCDGLTAAVQDIELRIKTSLGRLFYDQDFGSAIPDYVYDENTKSNRISLAAEVRRRVELDARVLAGSASCSILKWDENGLALEARWTWWETAEPQNLTVTIARPGAERLIEDLNLDH